MATERRRQTTSPARRARYQKRRAKRVARADNDLTDEQWEALLSAWTGCAYCGQVTDGLQRDCIQPIARGGRYTLHNVVPACRSCNASKGSDEVTSWMRRKKLDEATFLVRQRQVLVSLTSLEDSDSSDPFNAGGSAG